MVLHGHYLDHLAVIEPWTDAAPARQVDGDPFVADPRAADHAGFRAQDAVVEAQFDALIRPVPPARWDDEPVTPGWTLRDHVGHLADWATEGVARHRGLPPPRRTGWPTRTKGIDAWNERHVVASRRRRDARRRPWRGTTPRARRCWPRSTP